MKCHVSRTGLVRSSKRSLSPVCELIYFCAEELASVYIHVAGIGKGFMVRSGRGVLCGPWLHFR